MQWMAARDALHPHPDSARHPIAANRFQRIFRAGGIEAAGRRERRRYEELISAQQGYGAALQRRKSFSTSRWISANGASNAFLRGLMTSELCGSNSWRRRRTASRTRRRIRLRTTALPSARGGPATVVSEAAAGSAAAEAAATSAEAGAVVFNHERLRMPARLFLARRR